MSEFSARPVRYIVPDRDYQPPAPAYRRPGSDHSHLPHSVTAAPVRQETTTMTTTNATTALATTFDNAPAAERRDLILAQLQNGPNGGLSRAELKDRLGCLDGAVLDKTLWYMRERNKLIERTDEGCYRIPRAAERETAQAETSGKPVDLERLVKPRPGPVPPVPAPAAAPQRFAVTSDGCLLLWSYGSATPHELDPAATQHLKNLLDKVLSAA